MRPEEDVVKARKRNLRFYVARKGGRGGAWAKFPVVEDLDRALDAAKAESDYEVAVFVETRHGGFIYWTSRHPNVFNSTALEVM